MRVNRQTIVAVLHNAVKLFARFVSGVNVKHHRRQIIEMVQQFMPHFFSDGMPFRDGKARSNRNVQFSVQAVAYPSRPYLRYLLDTRAMTGRFSNSVDDVRLDSIQHTSQHGLARLPYDLKDRDGDKKSDDGVSQGISKPNTDRAE